MEAVVVTHLVTNGLELGHLLCTALHPLTETRNRVAKDEPSFYLASDTGNRHLHQVSMSIYEENS